MNQRELKEFLQGQLAVQNRLLDQHQGARILGRLEGAVETLEVILAEMERKPAPAPAVEDVQEETQ